LGVIGMSGWLLGGCAQLPDYAVPTRSLALDITQPGEPQPRAQMSDVPKGVQIAAPKPLDTPSPLNTAPRVEPTENIQQTSFANRGTVRVRVRAWVNGRPIFDNEVMQMAGPELSRLAAGLSTAER